MENTDFSNHGVFDFNFSAFNVKESSLFSDLSSEYERALTAECPDIYKMDQMIWTGIKALADKKDEESCKILRTFFGLSSYFIELLQLKTTPEINKLIDRYMLSFALNPILQQKILASRTEQNPSLYVDLSDEEQLRCNEFWIHISTIIRTCAPEVRALRSGLSAEFCEFIVKLDSESSIRLCHIPLSLYTLRLRCSEDIIEGNLWANESSEDVYLKNLHIDRHSLSDNELTLIDRKARQLRDAYRSLKFLQIVSNLKPERKREFSHIDYDAMLQQIPLSKIEAILNTRL